MALVKRLTEATEMPRSEWPPSLLRHLWETLMEVEAGRKLSSTHEARWLSLLGFALAAGLWHGGRRLARRSNAATVDRADVQQSDLPRGMVDSVAAHCRRIADRAAAGFGPAAGGRRSGAASRVGQGTRRREFKPGSHEAAELWRLLGFGGTVERRATKSNWAA